MNKRNLMLVGVLLLGAFLEKRFGILSRFGM